MANSNSIEAFRKVLRESRHVVAVAGAGLSTASGIPSWRGQKGQGGIWNFYDPAILASLEAFTRDPSLVWHHYHVLREIALHSTPNPAHVSLAMLCIPELLHHLASDAEFTLITQNIDGLSNIPESHIYEMHGRVLDTLCTQCSNLRHDGKKLLMVRDHPIPVDELPHCEQPECGGLLRPGVVWFDEVPRNSREIWRKVDEADLCLVIGTSSTVQLAAGFAHEIKDHGGKVAIFSIENVKEQTELADFTFLGPCEVTLPNVLFDSDTDRDTY
ncbi:DHS-like NAD/FAD-binding domain-containing protein [Lentinula edodes]|uniref:DHS-like NAD/FAD-binding domain-containing protein n=1 Tax=Lentinula edodes TaxID=5353 RepID=UPI001E8E9E7C|nr:DHS-like NAD/FAD-binding domain-containing protein [Lentinula edodes]KAH7879104.1 DHS-like NAD/FAD-binding domain-containing protein [Lentinula edodes]